LITTTPFQQPTKKTIEHDPDVIKEKGCRQIPNRMFFFCQPKQKVHYSITGMTKYYIKPASATILGTRRQANGFNSLPISFYNNRGTAVCASTIEIPDGWTPKLFLGLLLQE
jgi:hypothetical protein